jgi:hypothetical protein
MRFLAGSRPCAPDVEAAGVPTAVDRLGAGETHYDELERQLALGQVIKVPTITLEGDANWAPYPDASAELGRNTTLRCMHT